VFEQACKMGLEGIVSKRLSKPYQSGRSGHWLKVKKPGQPGDDPCTRGFLTDGTMTDRRFPPPWSADKIPGGYVVRDANGQALVYVYSRDNSRDNEDEARQAKVLTKDEARRIAVIVARLPELLGKTDHT
jgi:hypothetical protein